MRKRGRDEEGGMKIRGRAETELGEAGTVIESVQAREERAIAGDTACLHKCLSVCVCVSV